MENSRTLGSYNINVLKLFYIYKSNTYMEITFKNRLISVKTLTIDGKKLTKQFIQQIPLEYYVYTEDVEKGILYGVFKVGSNQYADYYFDGEIIGWINLMIETDKSIYRWAFHNELNGVGNGRFILILYVNSNGILKRSYLDRNSMEVVNERNGKPIEQIYI
jgi:hypothetical protein